MKQRLGRLEAQFLAYTQMRGLRTVRQGQLREPLRLTAAQERYLISRLTRGGLIARVVPGVYLVPQRLPLGGIWSPSPALALSTLMEERGGTYQVCGPSAFNRYGYRDQVPARIYAYNNRISGDRVIGKVEFSLIKVRKGRLGAVASFEDSDGIKMVYSSRARSLVDAVYDWSRFNSLPAAYRWIESDLREGKVEPEELTEVTEHFGNIGTIRRMGAILDRLNLPKALLVNLERGITRTSSPIPMNPRRPRKGTIDTRWGVLWNELD